MLGARLMLVTDRRLVPNGDLVGCVAAVLNAVPRERILVQLREKDLPARELVLLARALVALGATILVNDRADVALAAGAAGVHLPEAGMAVRDARDVLGPGAIVGASVHTAEAARRCDADVVVLGPIWNTPGKTAGGVQLLHAAHGASAAIFAIGGIDPERARTARAAGAHGVAVIRAVMAAADPARAAQALLG